MLIRSTPVTVLLLLLVFVFLCVTPPSTPLGINYGQVADNLPPPQEVIPLLLSVGATRVKLYDSNPAVLRAFAGTGIEFVIGLPDSCIPKLAKDPSAAAAWVKANVVHYIPATNITAVTVGNEVLTGHDTANIQGLIPAMQAVSSALAAVNLDGQVAVTTAHSLAILSNSYPPSAGAFQPAAVPYMTHLLAFLSKTGSPFLINAYPYFAYKADPNRVSLDYALFQPNPGVTDPKTELQYDNMLHAQVDAVHAAIAAVIGEEKAKRVVVSVSETGWPSKGDENEAGATAENARRYNGNLIKMVAQKKATPMRPDAPLEVYVFALFNEDLKPGPASERNYGLFKPDGSPAYHLGMVMSPAANSSVPAGGGEDLNSTSTLPEPSTGYYTITSAAVRKGSLLALRRMVVVVVFVLSCWVSPLKL